nr:unnamed protein product [Callosobruchus analis]
MDLASMSDYYKKLLVEHPDVATRYLEKIRKIDGIDPFSLKEDEISYRSKDFSPVTNMDIIAYLVFTSSFYTSQQMKAYKSLQAYKYFEAGFVHKCGAIKINNFMVY